MESQEFPSKGMLRGTSLSETPLGRQTAPTRPHFTLNSVSSVEVGLWDRKPTCRLVLT